MPSGHQPPWLSCYETLSLKNSLHFSTLLRARVDAAGEGRRRV